MFLKASNNYHPILFFGKRHFFLIQHTRLLQVGSQERLGLILPDRVGFIQISLQNKLQHSKSLFAAAYIWIEFLSTMSVPYQSEPIIFCAADSANETVFL
jgi:hypothetical protein